MNNITNLIRSFFTDEHIYAIDTSIPTVSEPNVENCYIEKKQEQSTEQKSSLKDTIEKHQEDNTIELEDLLPTDPQLLALYQECKSCRACELCNSALNLVFGDGNPNADLMIIGEAPGADEDEQGRPFVGRAGQLLIKILQKYNVQREEIFIANILKHRPPNNRNPLPAEITACTPFLKKQIEIIKPKLLITLGNFSSQYILNTKVGITKIRGSIQESEYGMVMPSLHPSAIIRGAYPVALLEQDVVKALQFIGYDVTLKE